MIDETSILAEIDNFMSVTKDAKCDYMKGYTHALQAVRGMIKAQLLAQKVGEANGRTEGIEKR